METKDKVYALLTPELVAAPKVTSAKWSSTGNWLLIAREDQTVSKRDAETALMGTYVDKAKPLKLLLLWGAAERKAYEIATIKPDMELENAAWLPGTDRLFVLVSRDIKLEKYLTTPDGKVTTQSPGGVESFKQELLVSTGGSQLEPIYKIDVKQGELGALVLEVSPSKPFAMLRVVHAPPAKGDAKPKMEEALYLIGRDGSAKAVKTPEPRQYPRWDIDGNPVVQTAVRVAPGQPAILRFYAVNTQTGATTLLAKEPAIDKTPVTANDTLRLNHEEIASRHGTQSVEVKNAWLSSWEEKETSAFIAGGLEDVVPSPVMNEVAYQQSGALFVRALIEVPRKAYDAAKLAARKGQLLMQAKQVGLAAIMYAADNDDILPSKNVNEILLPYLKDAGLLSNFVWTFGGGNANDVKAPAATPLGYVPGPGGLFAVVFVDGHAKWMTERSYQELVNQLAKGG